MIRYRSKRCRLWVGVFGAVLLLLSTAAEALVCPEANTVHFDKGQARFLATSSGGVTLRSRVTPVLMPLPALVPIKVTPMPGQETKSCYYHYSGNKINVVVLLPYKPVS